MLSYKDLGKVYTSGMLRVISRDLDSLDGCPQHVYGHFECYFNRITSLIGGPQRVDGWYSCRDNNLSDLIGCASHISDALNFTDNPITSLVGIHKIIKSCPRLLFDCEPIIVGGIGILLIENIIYISSHSEPFKIIAKYIGTGTKGMMDCRAELISKGYENYAKL